MTFHSVGSVGDGAHSVMRSHNKDIHKGQRLRDVKSVGEKGGITRFHRLSSAREPDDIAPRSPPNQERISGGISSNAA